MSEFDFNPYNTLGKIARAFVDEAENVEVHFEHHPVTHRSCLRVENSGLYLRDVRCWLADNISVEYGPTQDVIYFYDSNRL